MINLTIKGVDEIEKRLGRFAMSFNGQLKDALKKIGFTVEAEAKKVTPVRTGRLRASIRTDIYPEKVVVGPHTDYAVIVHEGGRGRRGRPYMDWGAKAAMPTIRRILNDVTMNAFRP